MSNYRAPLRTIVTDWRSGEIDPTFAMRVDSKALPTGALSLRNMMIRATGATERRPGMQVVATLPERCRLIEFEFDANEKYICAFAAGNLYIYVASGASVATFTGSIACPWATTTTVWEMNFLQRGDAMIIVHPTFRMRRLRRLGLSSFTMDILAFSSDAGTTVFNQPFTRYVRTTMALRVDAIEGSTAVHSAGGLFTAAWVGEHLQIYGNDIELTGYVSSTAMNCTVRQKVEAELGIAPIRASAGSLWVDITHVNHGLATGAVVTVNGAVNMPGILAVNLNGTFTINVIDADRYQYLTSTGSSESGDGGGSGITVSTLSFTTNWTEQVWSDRHGWPGAVTLHENRVWLGGSTDSPTFLAGSAVGDYYDFNVRDGLDDESVQGTISATTRIIHLVSAKNLQIFCENSESVVETLNGQPITPGSLKVINQTAYGCDPNVRPRVFDGATIFAQRNGKNIRELVYDFNTDSHVAAPISILSSHLIIKPNDVAVLFGTVNRPEQYAFFVNTNGTVACFHSIRQEELSAWTPFYAGGGAGHWFDSVCVIGTSIFFSVHRNATYTLERFELDRTDIWLDGAGQLFGSGTDWFVGTRFANTTVTVMLNGQVLGDFAVDNFGHITMSDTTGTITVGYDYGVTVIPWSPDKEMTDGGMTGEKRRIVSSTIHFHQSTSAAVNGQELLGFTIGQDPAAPPVSISAKKRVRHLGYGRDPVVVITQPAPGPLMVLGLTQEVSI